MTSHQRVWLIRHGEGLHNSSGRHNSCDPLLTQQGLEQAAALHGHKDLIACDLLVVSPMSRAVQTAVAIFGKKPSCRVVLSPLCSERYSGRCDAGRPKSQLLASFPFIASWDGFESLPEHWTHTKTSDFDWLRCRAPAFVAWLRSQTESRVAVVGHGCFFTSLLGTYLGNCEVAEMPDVAALIKTIRGDSTISDSERCHAAEALTPVAISFRTELEAMLGDELPEVRCHAARVLGNFGETAADVAEKVAVAEKLVPLLDDSAACVRSRAAEALGFFAEAASSHVHRVAGLLNDVDDEVRQNAVWTVGQMMKTRGIVSVVGERSQCKRRRLNAGDASLAMQIAALLKDGNSAVQWYTLEALGHIGEVAADIVADIVKFLENTDGELRQIAVWSLGQLGSAAASATQQIARLLQDPDTSVQCAALEALGEMGEAAGLYRNDVMGLLRHPDMQVRRSAVSSLRHFGALCGNSAKEVANLFGDPSPAVRYAAVEVFEIMRQAPPVIEKLDDLLEDPDPDVRAMTVAVLSKHRKTQLHAEMLLRLLRDSEPVVRLAAVKLVAGMHDVALTLRAAAVELLDDQAAEVRTAAAAARSKLQQDDLEDRRCEQVAEVGLGGC